MSELPKPFKAVVYETNLAQLNQELDLIIDLMMSQFLLIEFGADNPAENCVVQLMDASPDQGKKFKANVKKAPRMFEPYYITLLEEVE